MSELKLTGTIKQIGEKVTFDSGFSKVEFVLTTNENYPQDVKFEITKEKADNFLQYNKVGNVVDVKFNIRGNEFNNKYYVNLQAWHVASLKSDTPAPQQEEVVDDMPF